MPGTTTFTHWEEIFGSPIFLLKIIPQSTKQKHGFDGFNSDLKKRMENEGQNYIEVVYVKYFIFKLVMIYYE